MLKEIPAFDGTLFKFYLSIVESSPSNFFKTLVLSNRWIFEAMEKAKTFQMLLGIAVSPPISQMHGLCIHSGACILLHKLYQIERVIPVEHWAAANAFKHKSVHIVIHVWTEISWMTHTFFSIFDAKWSANRRRGAQNLMIHTKSSKTNCLAVVFYVRNHLSPFSISVVSSMKISLSEMHAHGTSRNGLYKNPVWFLFHLICIIIGSAWKWAAASANNGHWLLAWRNCILCVKKCNLFRW